MLVTSSPVDSVLQEGFSDYDAGPDLDDFHTMSKPQAMELLRSCEERGLLHSIWTFKTPFTAAICNCNLASGCMAMKLTAGYDIKVMWRGEDVAVLDAERCTGCALMRQTVPLRRHLGEAGGRDDSRREVLGVRNLQVGLPAAGDSARGSSNRPRGRRALVAVDSSPASRGTMQRHGRMSCSAS